MDDSYIVKTFFTDKGNRRSYLKIIDNDILIKNYLDNRFSNCSDYNEILWRIKLGYEDVPLCPICQKLRIKFYGSCLIGYSRTCSKECRDKLWHLNLVNTVKLRYGVENCFLSDVCKEKIKKTNLERYGCECLLADKAIREKYALINLEKYGVTNGGGSKSAQEKIKKHMLEKYGVTNPGLIPQVKKKIIETKRMNNTFNTSKEEETVYKWLCSKFNDVKRQYTSELYPFNCDFYIPELNMYIECNFHWTHGKHKFGTNVIDDIATLNEWKTKRSDFYNNAIDTWTKRDILKFDTAAKNNLNYKAFYNLDEALSYIDERL